MSKQGTFLWNELATGKARSAASFYTKLIGWKTEPMAMADGSTYTLFKIVGDAGPGAGGLFTMPKGMDAPDQWLPYVAVDDVDASAAKVKKLRGKVLQPPFDIEGVGRICIVADPNGARIGLMKPAMPAPAAKPRKAGKAKK